MGSGARLFNIYFNDIWIEDSGGEATQSNARADTLLSKPLWRVQFHRRRCLIPADGFYEWKRLDEKTKQPSAFALRSGQPFAFGGVWDA